MGPTLITLAPSAAGDPDPLPGNLPVCGDEDNGTIESPCDSFEHVPDQKVFPLEKRCSGTSGFVVDWVLRNAAFGNELAVYRVDGLDGSIGDLSPGDPGYLSTVLNRSQVVFPSGSDASAEDVEIEASPGEIFVFFMIQDDTLENLKANNPSNSGNKTPIAFFPFPAMNPDDSDQVVAYRDDDRGFSEFGFEDISGREDGDYDDIVFMTCPGFRSGQEVQEDPQGFHKQGDEGSLLPGPWIIGLIGAGFLVLLVVAWRRDEEEEE